MRRSRYVFIRLFRLGTTDVSATKQSYFGLDFLQASLQYLTLAHWPLLAQRLRLSKGRLQTLQIFVRDFTFLESCFLVF
jgi:hypothetical protein